jgi:hypothetical protein
MNRALRSLFCHIVASIEPSVAYHTEHGAKRRLVRRVEERELAA